MQINAMGINHYQYNGCSHVRKPVDEYRTVEPQFNAVLMDEIIKSNNIKQNKQEKKKRIVVKV